MLTPDKTEKSQKHKPFKVVLISIDCINSAITKALYVRQQKSFQSEFLIPAIVKANRVFEKRK
jgi:hypothetical protein